MRDLISESLLTYMITQLVSPPKGKQARGGFTLAGAEEEVNAATAATLEFERSGGVAALASGRIAAGGGSDG